MSRCSRLCFLALALIIVTILALPAMARGRGRRSHPRPSHPAKRAPSRPRAVTPQVIADEKAVIKARADLEKATTALAEASTKLTADFEKSPEMVEAKKAVVAAEAAVETARAAVIAKLGDTAAYKTAMASATAGQAELEKLRDSNAPQETISAKATAVLNLGNVTSRIEQDALALDAPYTDAQAKQVASTKALADLRTQFRKSLLTDPKLDKWRKAHDVAEAKVTADEAKLAAASR